MGERSGYTRRLVRCARTGDRDLGAAGDRVRGRCRDPAAGDVFHCPAGPPGHRLEAADPATFIDLTPVARASRPAAGSPTGDAAPMACRTPTRGIAVAALGLTVDDSGRQGAARDEVARVRERVFVGVDLRLVGGLDRGRILRDRRLAGLETAQHDLDRAATGTARNAPTSPPAAPPISRLTRTSSGEMPIVLRITSGTRTLPSMSWMTT